MQRIEKTVFISYRRTNVPWALAVFQNLQTHGYDVFFDYDGINSGDFEQVIFDNIAARAHFIVILTPSALERCSEPKDWLRREIEAAIKFGRNIVPLMIEGFSFGTMAAHLTGSLVNLRNYNGLTVPADYFMEAMDRLRNRFLSGPLSAVLHPKSVIAQTAASEQITAASAAPEVSELELTALQWFERGYEAKDPNDKIRFYTEAIYLKPDLASAYSNRGNARNKLNNREQYKEAIKDCTEAIRLQADSAYAYNNRANSKYNLSDFAGAIEDFSEAIRLKPDFPLAFKNRAVARRASGDKEGARQDEIQNDLLSRK